MSNLDLFRTLGGIDLQNEALDSHAYILQGSGLPGADAGAQDAAPIGSVFLRTDATTNHLQFYTKFQTTTSSSADWTILADKAYVDTAIIGLTWRPPVVAIDHVTTLATGTAGNPIVVDGVSVTNGQRVLFANLTTDPNVYIYNQTTGTFAVDPHDPSVAGDALFVTGGTVGTGQRWTFNGTQWVLFGAQTDVSEITYIDAFIGKGAIGAVTPTYSSNYTITTGNSLVAAASALDAALGSGTITSGNVLTSNLAFTGPAPGGNGTLTVTAAIDALNVALGSLVITNVAGNYPILVSPTTVTTALNELNNAIEVLNVNALSTTTIISTSATFTTVDSLVAADADEVKWLIQVREVSATGNRRASEIHAITDGTNVDFTRYAELTLGSSIAGFGVQVVISGANLLLQVKATNTVDVVVKRVAISHF